MKNILYIIFFFSFFLSNIPILGQQTPASKQKEIITITGVTAHIGNGTVIKNCGLTFENGKITAIGSEVTPKGTILDATGKHVYPGFIAPNTTLGLVEIGAVRALSLIHI